MTRCVIHCQSSRTGRRAPLGVCLSAVVLLALMLITQPAAAQLGGFGQNKIQYQSFKWRVLRGPHLDVFYYAAEDRVARVALAYGEESYRVLERRFAHSVKARVPLIIYASHGDFQQTNVFPFVPPEEVLGITESLKGRVTIPFRGNYSEFRHTLRHELVHVFQYAMAAQAFKMRPSVRSAALPLWFTEGLAESFSSTQDTRDEMVVRDLVLDGRMPSIAQLNQLESAIVYPLGGELHGFLARRFGEWRIPLLYSTLWKYGSFAEALEGTYGMSLSRMNEEWHYELRQRFFPAVTGRRPVALAGREIATIAVKPVVIAGDSAPEIAYLSPRTGYMSIYRQPLDGPARPRRVVTGERSPEFESFHAFNSRLDSRNGVLVFASKYGDRDALFFWSLREGRVIGRYQFDSLVGIVSPTWAPDGRRVVFSGLVRAGVSDLYLFEMNGKRLTRLTDDAYEDSDPTWLPGDRIVFSSDRAEGGEAGAHNLYMVQLGSRALSRLTAGRWSDESPRWDDRHARVLFSSDRDGTFNLYSVDTLGAGRRETRLDDGALEATPIPGDDRLVVGAFSRLSYSLFALPTDSAARRDTFSVASRSTAATWSWSELSDSIVTIAEERPYKRRFTLDFAAGDYNGAAGWGSAQGGMLYFADLLGDEAVTVSLSSYGYGRTSNLFDNINGDVFYLNQTRRLNWGAGVFRTAGDFFTPDLLQVYRERTLGAYGALRYPLSRFARVEAQTRLEYSDRDDFGDPLVEGPTRRRGVLASNVFSMTSDNTLWLQTGPIDGTRWSASGGVVSDVTHGTFENWIGAIDARRYLRTSFQSAFAVRAFGYISEGVRPRATLVSGPWLLRGYPVFTVGGTRAWVTNAEFRFPITDYAALGFPFGTIGIPAVHGAFFNDFGQAWYKRDAVQNVLGSAGGSLRMPLVPGLVLRLDVGRTYSIGGPRGRHDRFVDFFFGYNY
jgi:hypothetical protein